MATDLPTSPGPKPVVLVVEDEALLRLAAMQIVEEAGYEAIDAPSADDAIQLLEARSDIQVVFTDVHMPGTMDGLKLARYIRERWPPIHLVVASGVAILTEKDLPAGATFFHKPYLEAHIAKELKRLLG